MSSDTTIDRAVAAAPGTVNELAKRLGVSRATAGRWVAAAVKAGRLEMRIRWINSLAYTRVYRVPAPKAQEQERSA